VSAFDVHRLNMIAACFVADRVVSISWLALLVTWARPLPCAETRQLSARMRLAAGGCCFCASTIVYKACPHPPSPGKQSPLLCMSDGQQRVAGAKGKPGSSTCRSLAHSFRSVLRPEHTSKKRPSSLVRSSRPLIPPRPAHQLIVTQITLSVSPPPPSEHQKPCAQAQSSYNKQLRGSKAIPHKPLGNWQLHS